MKLLKMSDMKKLYFLPLVVLYLNKESIMHRSVYCLALALFISVITNAQSLNESFSAIQKSITTVKSEKLTIEPEFTFDNNTYGKVNLSLSTTNTKGSVSNISYHWNMADIDVNTVVRYVKGKQVSVKIAIKNKQKFIRQLKNNKVSYISELLIPMNNTNDAEVLIKEIKASIELADLGKLKWDTYRAAMDWIKNKISDQQTGGKSYTQSLNDFPLQNNKIVFKQLVTSSKGSVTDNLYEFYINDLFENTVNLNISGDRLEIKLKTIGDKKLIKHTQNGKRLPYVSGVTILTADIDLARNLIIAFQTAISKFEKPKKEFSSIANTLAFVDSKVMDIKEKNEAIQQNLKSDTSGLFKSVYTKITTSSKGNTKEENYTFFWEHIDPNFIEIDISGKNLYLVLKSKGNKKYISHIKDGKKQALTNEVKIEFTNLATAREIINALKYSIPLSKAEIPEFSYRMQAINWLKENIGKISENEEDQLFEIVNSKFILNVSPSGSKGKIKQMSYEFYPFTLGEDLAQIEIKSKKIILKLGVNHKNKYVKYIENGALKSYSSEVPILCRDIIEAEIMKAAFIYIIQQTPELGEFSSTAQALAYLKSNIGKVEIPGITFNQSISNKSNDKDILLFSFDEVSAKGKAESRLYEFNPGYLSPEQIKLNVKGKELFIEVFTREKQKLIKSYKNNELQNYTNTLQMQVNDVLAGMRLEIALKMLAKAYEK